MIDRQKIADRIAKSLSRRPDYGDPDNQSVGSRLERMRKKKKR